MRPTVGQELTDERGPYKKRWPNPKSWFLTVVSHSKGAFLLTHIMPYILMIHSHLPEPSAQDNLIAVYPRGYPRSIQ